MLRPWKRSASAVAGALFMLLPVSLGAQDEPGTISGTVRDVTGAALSGVAVSLTGPSLPESVSARSDAAGGYRFAAVPAGSYDLGFRLDGYAPGERNGVSLAAGGAVIVTMTLQAAPRETSDPTSPAGEAAGMAPTAAGGMAPTDETGPARGSVTEDTAITTRADLALSSSASLDPVIAGTGLAYTVTVTNHGPSDARGVVVSDVLPAAVTFGSTAGCAEDPAGEATCTLGIIPAGGSKQYTVAGTLSSAASGSLTHRVSVASQTAEAQPGDESASETTTETCAQE